MKQYQTFEFNDKEYYLVNDINDFDKTFFRGCKNNLRNIIDRKNIDDNNIHFANKRKGEWVDSHMGYKKAKLFITKDWVFDNVPRAFPKSTIVPEVEKLPPKVYLEDDQKFTDGESTYDITMRGEREMDKCYFRVKDIGSVFELKSLSNTVIHKKNSYERNIDYKYFINTKMSNRHKSKNKKFLYFTYNGLIKCLYISKSPQAKKFREWANKILFTYQFGNKEEKQCEVSKLLGVHAKAIKETFKASAKSIPCIYLFTLGTVKDLRKSMSIDDKYSDDYIICKYGYTANLEKRTGQHIRNFKKIKNVNLHLKYYSYIDPVNISKAECNIKDYFEDINVDFLYKNYKELVILNPKKLNDTIKTQYENIQNMYVGHNKEIILKMERLENKLILQEQMYKNKLLQKDLIIQKERSNAELVLKDNEILKLKLELINKDK